MIVRCLVASLLAGLTPGGLRAQEIPTIDTEDASLGSLKVGNGRFHPTAGIDIRNGDFARGNYDDDGAGIDRLPVHLQIGFGWDLHDDGQGETDLWLVGTSSNGLHAPKPYETDRPRAWYESNTVLGIVAAPAKGLRTGLAYAIKTSPNGVAGTSQEASATLSYEGERGLGILHPGFVATIRPKGGHGVFTQATIAPELPLSDADDAATLSLPLAVGVGLGGFYEAGSGSVVYGSAGLGLTKPFVVGATQWRLNAQALALVRDGTLRRLGGERAGTATVVPLVTIGLAVAY